MRLGISNNHRGYYLKTAVSNYLSEQGYFVVDLGTKSAFETADIFSCTEELCCLVNNNMIDKGILISGTGIGMSIAANKHKGIRAVLVQDVLSAEAASEQYNGNILCLGAQVCGEGLAALLVETWLNRPAEGNDFKQRIRQLECLENKGSLCHFS